MSPPLLTLKDIHLSFGSKPLLNGADMTIAAGEQACLVGRNGSGKSTLLKVAAGLVEPDHGERFVQPGAIIRYLPQEVDFTGFKTLLDYVVDGLAETQGTYTAERVIDALKLNPKADPTLLSGGEARRAALARVLAPEPDVILLDEPTNHLDLPTIQWLEEELASIRSAMLLISHDRRFLENLSKTTLWIDRGQARRLSRGFKHFEAWRDDVLEQEAQAQHKLDRKIAREESWMYDGGVSGRRKRNMRRVAELQTMRAQRADHTQVQGNVTLAASDGQTSGKLVAEVEGISKAFGDTPIVTEFSTRIQRGDRIGFVGPNGAGKTTLIKMLTGLMEPDIGRIRLGTKLDMVVLDQKRDELNPEWTVADALTGGRGDQVIINGKPRHVASYMKDFLFEGEQARSPLSVLSGGERGRLMLARALAKPSNLLVLDEPTNDLDLETLELLQEMLADYPGTLLLVSHDRDFLDRVVTSVIAPEGDGTWTEYAGGYSDMMAQRRGKGLKRRTTKGGDGGTANGTSKRSGAATKSGTGSDGGSANKPTKLTFNDKHALETLPKQMEKLEAEATRLGEMLSDPELFNRDPAAFEKTTIRLGEVQSQLEVVEEQWLNLELKREALEG
ncbi:MAG: ATP-binding cassette domain-containing protein [Pseudomonadota bacterium]